MHDPWKALCHDCGMTWEILKPDTRPWCFETGHYWTFRGQLMRYDPDYYPPRRRGGIP